MAIRIDNAGLLTAYRAAFQKQVATIRAEEAERAAKAAAAAVRDRVLALCVDLSVAIDSRDYKTADDILLQVRFDAAIPPGPSVERIYVWRPGHMETCEANYGGLCDCVAGKHGTGMAP